jgi:pseudouridine-5'-phosphate glycosidase
MHLNQIRLDSAVEIATVLQIQWQLGLAGVLIANPIPLDRIV